MNKMNKQELITNKQELISKYELLKNGYNFKVVATDGIISDLKRLDEPEKPIVPQFVADWYEEYKDNFDYNLWEYLVDWDRQNPSDFKEWIAEGDKYDPLITLINMHQFGYEVEKEKRYKVVMPNVSSSGGVLTRIKHDDSWIWIDTLETIVEGRTHTRKELEEAGFGWVFDCPGIKIEEVE